MGDSLAQIAQDLHENNFLGVEVHSPGVGNLLNIIHDQEINNLKLIQHDAVEVLKEMILDNTLDGVHIFFPDPWHKKRHNKRRLIQLPFVELLAKKMKKDSYVHIASDWDDYSKWILETFKLSNSF